MSKVDEILELIYKQGWLDEVAFISEREEDIKTFEIINKAKSELIKLVEGLKDKKPKSINEHLYGFELGYYQAINLVLELFK